MSTVTIEQGPQPENSTSQQSARNRLINAASDLFCRYGINATGIEAVIEAAGTAKATLYKTFGSKEGLIEAVLEAEGKAWRDWFIHEINSYPGDAKAKLIGIFDILEIWFAKDRFFGCPFINAVGEFDKKDTRYKEIALSHKTIVMHKIAQLAQETGDPDANDLAHQIGLLIDGAIVAALITGNPQMARVARNAAAKVV
ncbi:MAG: TetR/AcrR family transcriptional regulator [Hyphomicrobiales bacterium]|nr:TetR/AcrR family transcriptional regulator [Hyphomicrobiales bacterium]